MIKLLLTFWVGTMVGVFTASLLHAGSDDHADPRKEYNRGVIETKRYLSSSCYYKFVDLFVWYFQWQDEGSLEGSPEELADYASQIVKGMSVDEIKGDY